MLTSTMKIEMYRPDFPLSWLFARRHVHPYFNFSRVFVPAWYRCLADTSNAGRRGSRVGIQMGVFLAGFDYIKGWGDVSDMCIVEFDEHGVEPTEDRRM